MDERQQEKTHRTLALVAVVVLASATLVFGAVRFNKLIFAPFIRRPPLVPFKTTEQLEKERMEALKTKDTDSDGLKDYDELYIFRTSPFLEDSDSDGENDGIEVAQGTDPNCPKGKTCRQPRVSSTVPGLTPSGGTEPESDLSAEAQAAITQVFTETFGDLSQLTPQDLVAKLNSMSGTELRQFMIKIGLPEDEVNKADEATLRNLLNETFGEMGVGTGSTGGSGPGTSP